VRLFPSGASHQFPSSEEVLQCPENSFDHSKVYQEKNHLQYAFGGGKPNFAKCWENQIIVQSSPSIGKTLAFNSLRGLEAELSVRGLMSGNAMPECPDAILGRHGRGYIRLRRVNGTSKGHESERRMTHQHQKT